VEAGFGGCLFWWVLSGWQYRDWRGVLYPPGVLQRAWLEYYADRYVTVENNGTFYRLPSPQTFADWRARTPDGFVMAVRPAATSPTSGGLRDPAEPVGRLLRAAAGLGDRLGPVLLQLPPDFRADPGALDGCLDEFSRAAATVGVSRPGRGGAQARVLVDRGRAGAAGAP